ncbi:putative ATP-dependent zinc protease [Haloarcula brevis]|uniref:putative ATP-dependent zinc protease n=1 Tax=Haloarcula brevis TaxID=3111453 RepID=UPI00300E7442
MTALHTAKPVLGAVETATLFGATDSAEVDARIDTGAKRTCVDRSLAESIGILQPIDEAVFRSSTDDSDTREIIHLTVVVKNQKHEIKASVTDRANFSAPLRLGRDVLRGYLVDVEQ